MDDLAQRLSDALGVECVGADCASERLFAGLSLLAVASFDFCRVEVLGEGLLVARPKEDMTPRSLVRLLGEVARASSDTVVCSLPSITPYLRRTLLSARRGFVSDDGQAYVPGLLRLMPQGERKRPLAPGPWSPAERLAFVYLLLHVGESVTSADLVAATGLSATSAKRALARVSESAPLERTLGGRTGRAAIWRVVDPEAFVEQGTAVFGEVVRRRFFVEEKDVQHLPYAGTSALAKRSLLAPPITPRRACSAGDASALVALQEMPAASVPVCEVLVLGYDPLPVAMDGLVDMYTMLRTVDRSDERIDLAVEEATEGCPWLRLA